MNSNTFSSLLKIAKSIDSMNVENDENKESCEDSFYKIIGKSLFRHSTLKRTITSREEIDTSQIDLKTFDIIPGHYSFPKFDGQISVQYDDNLIGDEYEIWDRTTYTGLDNTDPNNWSDPEYAPDVIRHISLDEVRNILLKKVISSEPKT